LIPRNGPREPEAQTFDPNAEHPTYYGSEAELARHWRQIDRGPVGGAAQDEDWRDLDP